MNKQTQKRQRQKRIRAKIQGTKDLLRLSVFRSNRSVSVQLIDDSKGITILGLSQKHLENTKGNKTEQAKMLGILLAQQATAKKIKHVAFDRGAYRYHGRVKAVADGAREGGLKF